MMHRFVVSKMPKTPLSENLLRPIKMDGRLRGWKQTDARDDGRWRRSLGAGALLALVPAVLGLSGCQAVNSTASGSQLRLIQASADAPGLDFYVNGTILANNIGFGNVTSYVPANPGTYTITATTAGTKQALAAVKQTFASGQQYTVLVGDQDAVESCEIRIWIRDRRSPLVARHTRARWLARTGLVRETLDVTQRRS